MARRRSVRNIGFALCFGALFPLAGSGSALAQQPSEAQILEALKPKLTRGLLSPEEQRKAMRTGASSTSCAAARNPAR